MEENTEYEENPKVSEDEAKYFFMRASNYKYRNTFRIVERELYDSIKRRDAKLITELKYRDICDCRTKIDRDVLFELIKYCANAKELREASYRAYMNALKYKLFDDEEFTKNFTDISKYNYEAVKNEAKKYTYRSEFMKGSEQHYAKAVWAGWLDDVCSHMPKRKPRKSKYTNAFLLEEASKYSSQAELRNENYAIFIALAKRKILTLVTYKK